MNSGRWQYSLRSLFFVMTLLAAVVAFTANYPRVALACLLLAAPVLMGWVTAYCFNHSPRLTRVIMVLLGTGFLVTSGRLGLHAYDRHDFDEWGAWIVLGLLLGFALMCYWIAWAISRKMPQIATTTRDKRTP